MNIDVGGTGDYEIYAPGEAAVQITGEGDVTMELDGKNIVQGGVYRAGVEKNDADSSGSLTITDENGTDGSLKATGGLYASGIGGGYNYIGEGTNSGKGTGSNITVSGDAQVKAQGGNYYYSNGSNNTQGAGAAIGNGGHDEKGDNPVKAKGEDAVVTTDAPQDGKSYGLYVGELKEGWVATYAPGENMDTANPGSLTYQGGIEAKDAVPVPRKEPTCTEAGHEAGFMIGDVLVAVTIPATGHNVPDGTPNGDATCVALGTMTGICTNCSTEVTVPDPNYGPHTFTTYTPDPDHLATCTEAGKEIAVCDVCKTATDVRPDPAKGHNVPNGTPNGDATCVALGTMTGICTNCSTEVTVPDPNYGPHTFTTYTPDPDHLATCTEAGTKTAVCDVCKNETDTIPDPAKNHSMGDFSTYKEATCTEAGEERAYCKNKCGHYETKDIPPQGHSFTKYISDGNATYTSDGTKTAKCDHCDATDTLPDPGSKLVFLPGAFYKVIGKDGKALVCKETNQNGVLTITAEEDFATLTGSLSGMKTLKAHGIDTIVFVTKGATSTFAVEDLLSQGASDDSYQLTHDGSTVTFTLNDSTDIRKILK